MSRIGKKEKGRERETKKEKKTIKRREVVFYPGFSRSHFSMLIHYNPPPFSLTNVQLEAIFKQVS